MGKDDFLARYPGAFFCGRFKNLPPMILFVPRQEGIKVRAGSGEDCEFSFEEDQTVDENHITISYHLGFRGWTVTEETKTSFGTYVDNERLTGQRPLLLADKQVIKIGGGLSELQIYFAETLWTRMSNAGITKRLAKKKKAPPIEEPAREPDPVPDDAPPEFDSEDLGV
jgi:hypothetical protein